MISNRLCFAVVAVAIMLSITSAVRADEDVGVDKHRAAFNLDWHVVSSGGIQGVSTSFEMGATAGQLATGFGESESFMLSHGFWLESGGPDFVCGDANASGGVDIDDVVFLIAYIFTGGDEPVPYESGDANCSGTVDIDDVVWLISYIFTGGYAPCDSDGNEVPDC